VRLSKANSFLAQELYGKLLYIIIIIIARIILLIIEVTMTMIVVKNK
jgi:hypothetical protein